MAHTRVVIAFCLVSMLALLTSMPALAQGVEITPFGGYTAGGDFNLIDGSGQVDLDGSAHYGLLVDIPIGPPNLRLELLWSRQNTDLELDLFGNPQLVGVDISHAQIGMVYEWQRGNLRPFFVGMVGIASFDPEQPGIDHFSDGSVALGGGTKFLITPHFGFRLEGRMLGIHTKGSEAYCAATGCALRGENPLLWQFQGSAGLIFSF